jgi:cysteine desulfuration protein SufE
MNTLKPGAGIEKIKEVFQVLSSWEDKYKKIIELGKALSPLPEGRKTPEALVKGCQSQVWLHAKLVRGKLFFEGDSDALIVKGLVAVLLAIYSGKTPEEVLMTGPDFIAELGFSTNLSPSRANGLVAMIKQIHRFALVYKTLTDRGIQDSPIKTQE